MVALIFKCPFCLGRLSYQVIWQLGTHSMRQLTKGIARILSEQKHIARILTEMLWQDVNKQIPNKPPWLQLPKTLWLCYAHWWQLPLHSNRQSKTWLPLPQHHCQWQWLASSVSFPANSFFLGFLLLAASSTQVLAILPAIAQAKVAGMGRCLFLGLNLSHPVWYKWTAERRLLSTPVNSWYKKDLHWWPISKPWLHPTRRTEEFMFFHSFIWSIAYKCVKSCSVAHWEVRRHCKAHLCLAICMPHHLRGWNGGKAQLKKYWSFSHNY